MTDINRLTSLDTLSPSDLLPVYSSANSDARKVSAGTMAAFVQSQASTAAGAFQKQYASPNASGFSVTVSPVTTGNNVHLLMTPLAGYAAGTVTLPASPVDSQRVLVTSTQAVSTLTVSGGTVNGAPTALTANGYFQLVYDQVLLSWYRVG